MDSTTTDERVGGPYLMVTGVLTGNAVIPTTTSGGIP
jgi:hypothetical protein